MTEPTTTPAPEPAPTPAPVVAAPEPKVAESSPLNPAPAEPIKYEFKLPEGVKLDETRMTQFTELGNKIGLAPDKAQTLLDYHLDQQKTLRESLTKEIQDSNTNAFSKVVDGWKTEINADPELSGANEPKAREIIGKALDSYFSKEAREAFDLTGAGWNPHIVKGMLKMAKALSEGQPTTVGAPAKGREVKTPGSVFYPQKGN